MSLHIEPVLFPIRGIADDVVFDVPVFLFVADNMIIKFGLPTKFRPMIAVAPFFYRSFEMVGVHGNGLGHRFAKRIGLSWGIVPVNDDQCMQVIGHDDEFVQNHVRVQLRNVLKADRCFRSDFAQATDAVNDCAQQAFCMCYANGNEICIGGCVIKFP
jgi:hypothetical protein